VRCLIDVRLFVSSIVIRMYDKIDVMDWNMIFEVDIMGIKVGLFDILY